MKVVIEIGRFFCNIFFSTLVRVKVTGLENIPADGPLIIASNHVTAADVIFLEYKLKHRHICWMAKAELFQKKTVGWFLRSLGAFPVKRGVLDVGAAKTMLSLLEEGKTVGIFPQGTRSKDFSNPVKARQGVVKFAVESGAQVLPTAIFGDFRLFGKICVKYGKPVVFEEKPDGTVYSKTEYIEMAQKLMDGIYDMMEEPDDNNKG